MLEKIAEKITSDAKTFYTTTFGDLKFQMRAERFQAALGHMDIFIRDLDLAKELVVYFTDDKSETPMMSSIQFIQGMQPFLQHKEQPP